MVTQLKYLFVPGTLQSWWNPTKPFINTAWMSSLPVSGSNRSVTIAAGPHTTYRSKLKKRGKLNIRKRFFYFCLTKAPEEVSEVTEGNRLSPCSVPMSWKTHCLEQGDFSMICFVLLTPCEYKKSICKQQATGERVSSVTFNCSYRLLLTVCWQGAPPVAVACQVCCYPVHRTLRLLSIRARKCQGSVSYTGTRSRISD